MLTRPVLEKTPGFLPWLAIQTLGWLGCLFSAVEYRGYWYACRWVGSWFTGKNATCLLELSPDSAFTVSLHDPYWTQLIAEGYHYEDDFAQTLHRLKSIDFVFMDCGANFGYWSILLSSKAFGSRQVLAIEASQTTYQNLMNNCQQNSNRFVCLHRAISAQSGETVYIDSTRSHAGAHISHEGSDAATSYPVQTIRLDDAVAENFPELPARLLIKLDVEGQEINAFKSARQIQQKLDVLFYYEDHGKDASCAVTRYVLEEANLKVFFCGKDGQIHPIQSVQDAAQVKVKKSYGYNFFACQPDSAFMPLLAAKHPETLKKGEPIAIT
ncbi:MAG: FkbM family methyltransferase [Vampirovibrio sp.]|nr:FkbM family methyltransferase [Vampirovibrio sp.]